MNDATERNTGLHARLYAGLYAIRLLAPGPGAACTDIAGRVEHVLSGRCHDFADGAALAAWMLLEQQQQQPVVAAGRP